MIRFIESSCLRTLLVSFADGMKTTKSKCVNLAQNSRHIHIPSSSGNESSVVHTTDDSVCLIGINRPSKRNAVDHDTAVRLLEAFQRFEQHEQSKVAVLYGVGNHFCSGYDLSSVASGSAGDLKTLFNEFCKRDGNRPMGPTKMAFSKPVVAAVSGYCVAGGLELALMCDLRCADHTAVFGVFCRRLGVPLIDGGTIRLPKLIGGSRALDMILTGRPIDAKTAFDWGLVNKLGEKGTAIGQAVKLARSISQHPQECLKADRRSTYHAMYDAPTLDDAFQYELDNSWHVLEQESLKGATRFAVDGFGRHGKLTPQDFTSSRDDK